MYIYIPTIEGKLPEEDMKALRITQVKCDYYYEVDMKHLVTFYFALSEHYLRNPGIAFIDEFIAPSWSKIKEVSQDEWDLIVLQHVLDSKTI